MEYISISSVAAFSGYTDEEIVGIFGCANSMGEFDNIVKKSAFRKCKTIEEMDVCYRDENDLSRQYIFGRGYQEAIRDAYSRARYDMIESMECKELAIRVANADCWDDCADELDELMKRAGVKEAEYDDYSSIVNAVNERLGTEIA